MYFKMFLEKHEQKVTSLINEIDWFSYWRKDHATNQFLQWYVKEQVEEEESANESVAKVKELKVQQIQCF